VSFIPYTPSIVPVLLLASLYLLYLALMDVLSPQSCGFVALVLLQLVSEWGERGQWVVVTATTAPCPMPVSCVYVIRPAVTYQNLPTPPLPHLSPLSPPP
jgi:hypothetical protein